jgi:hypothetical protein
LAPVTDQFTRVLLSFKTVAVHCEVPSKVTSVGVQDMLTVGATAVLDPQELMAASIATNPNNASRRTQRALPHSK